MSYRELTPPPALSGRVRCAWTLHADEGSGERVLPDGCLDLVHFEDGALLVAGPDTAARVARRTPRSVTVGLRFQPGAAPGVLGLPADELRDVSVPIEDVWGRAGAILHDRLLDAAGPEQRARLLFDAVASREQDEPDQLVAAAVRRLEVDPRARVSRVARELWVSERQLRRRFHAAVGYGPKTLARVLRLQRLLAIGPRSPLAQAAVAAGYADQAHMSAECRSLTGVTPKALLQRRS